MPTLTMTATTIHHFSYNKIVLDETRNVSVNDLKNLDTSTKVNWVDIITNNNTNDINEIGNLFSIDQLVIEDIVHTNQRAKLEEYDDFQYIVLKMYHQQGDKTLDQQISFVLRDNLVLSFRERDFGVLKPIQEQLKNSSSKIRQRGEDFLLYSLLDTIIDQYYVVLNYINDKVEHLDAEIFKEQNDGHIYTLQRLKKDILEARKDMLPVRELISNLTKNEVSFFEPANKKYLRDLQDHMTRNVEQLDFDRDQINSLIDVYYSLQNHKMNNVMKTLTGVSFVLLPLNFLASLYGMNFSKLYFAEDPHGFDYMLGLMAIVGLVLTYLAFRRKWLSTRDFTKRIK